MRVYVDASVLLRIVLGEPDRLDVWPRIDDAVSSELVRVESLRTIDRARIVLGLPDDEVARRRSAILEAIDAFSIVPVNSAILERAAEPFPTLIGSLDAIHLASAVLVRAEGDDLSFATHDLELGRAARSVGFEVHGVSDPTG